MEDNDAAIEAPVKAGAWGVFRGEISLGNLLIVAGMVGTGIVGIYTVGGNVQRLQDSVEQVQEALRHETTLRTQSEAEWQREMAARDREYTQAMASMQRQETADVGSINSTLSDVRNDIRMLVQRSGHN